ncbi:MAG: DUF5916 domain-containing protein [bacterium]
MSKGQFRVAITLVALVVASSAAYSQSSVAASKKPVAGDVAGARTFVLPASRSRAVVIDGRFDEAAWATAAVASDFVQQSPQPGGSSAQRTEARVLVDGNAIYVALHLFDSAPDSIVGKLTRRDEAGYSDWAHVYIDSFHDRRTAFHFAVNPSGVKRDGYISGDNEFSEDFGWDAVWEVATRHDSTGWTAEFRIPLSQLRFAGGSDAEGATWGIEFARDIARRGERSYWAPILPDAGSYVSSFGTVVGVPVREAKRRFEMTPYTLARSWRSAAYPGNALRPPVMQTAAAGADFKLGLTSDLTITGTVNPDFGQVEADPAQVNLTGAETLLSERRTFFTEGSDLFRYQLSWVTDFGDEKLVYTRRVGRAPQLDLPDATSHTVATDPTRLLGATKLSGRLGSWRVGLLSATTAEEVGEYSRLGGIAHQVVEPLTHYGVVRLGRDFNDGKSQLGFIATATNRRLESASVDELHSAAYAGGVEGETKLGGKNYVLSGYAFGSSVVGSRAAIARTQTSFRHLFQRDPVALGLDSAATSLSGLSSELRFVKVGGGLSRAGITAHIVTRGFDVNDLGYLTRSNFMNMTAWVGRSRSEPTEHTRLWWTYANARVLRSLTGAGDIAAVNWWNRVQFQNYWELTGYVERVLSGTSYSLLRGGPAIRTPARNYATYELSTDPRQRLSWTLNTSGSLKSADGSWLANVSPGLIFRPIDRADIQITPTVEWQRLGTQFISDSIVHGAHNDLVGDLMQRTASITVRSSFAFTPALTVQFYAQPFVSSGRFRRTGEVTNPLASRADDRVRYLSPGEINTTADGQSVTYRTAAGDMQLDNPEFDTRTLTASAVLRWEYRPGSTLYAVWNQGRDQDARVPSDAFSDVARRLLSTPATNVLLLKWAHYLGR